MEQNYDYGEHTPSPGAEVVREITEMVDIAGELDEQIKLKTAELADLQSSYNNLVERDLPNKMKMCGLDQIATPAGYKVSIEKDLFASIPSPTTINKERDPVKRRFLIARRLEAFKWLEDNKHDSIINREITVKLGKGKKDSAHDLVERLRKEDGYHVDETVDVHHSTLRALLKQLRKDKQDFPVETFGVFDKAVAKVSKK